MKLRSVVFSILMLVSFISQAKELLRDVQQLGNEIGKHKVMMLRNIALTPPYGHNGVLETLEQVVHFYNSRDNLGAVRDNTNPRFGKSAWPQPEVPQNINSSELGNLGLSPEEEKAIVAFLKTLTDDYQLWGLDSRVPPDSPPPFLISP